MDQDINCRVVGRCAQGAPINRELGDLILRHPALEKITLTEDLGRDFLYARHNADLANLNPEQAAKMDSIAHIDGLARIGCKLAEEVPSDHFRLFDS